MLVEHDFGGRRWRRRRIFDGRVLAGAVVVDFDGAAAPFEAKCALAPFYCGIGGRFEK